MRDWLESYGMAVAVLMLLAFALLVATTGCATEVPAESTPWTPLPASVESPAPAVERVVPKSVSHLFENGGRVSKKRARVLKKKKKALDKPQANSVPAALEGLLRSSTNPEVNTR